MSPTRKIATKKTAVRRTALSAPKAAATPPDDGKRFTDMFSLAALRASWKTVRKEAKDDTIRDVVDYLDWAVSIEATLPVLRDQIISGAYRPCRPSRYEMPKGKGSYRVVTVPNIRDVLVYRLISDKALDVAIPAKVGGAFFSRRHAATPIGKTFSISGDPSHEFFEIWLRYQEYRSKTMLNSPYEVLVVTDITNYFDSISHELLMEYLAPLGLPRKAAGLLGCLLEALKPPAGHSPNPRIGIPVDAFDCSRQLAHVFLFEHDRRTADRWGEDNYVRWMDDQNIGAESLSQARQVVNHLTRSLACQRLTLNAGKTQFLEPDDVVEYFQLDANAALSDWDSKHKPKHYAGSAKTEIEALCASLLAGTTVDKGHWDKILKRMYGYLALVGSDAFDSRMYRDLVEHPHLNERIFLALAARNETQKLLRLFSKYVRSGESLFEATEAIFFDACLLLNPSPSIRARLVAFAKSFARGKVAGQSTGSLGKATAIVCIYWFGGGADDILRLYNRDEAPVLPTPVARAWLACGTALDASLLPKFQRKLVGHGGDDVARLSRFLDDLISGKIDSVGAYKHKRKRWPLYGSFYDVRAWLQLDLLSWAMSKKLRRTASADLKLFARLARRQSEKRALRRVMAKLT